MAEISTMARPYAKAAFELAVADRTLADWSAMLAGVAGAVRDPQVASAIGHPLIGRGQLAELLVEAFGNRLTPGGQNLLRLLSEYDRLKLVPAIAEQFEHLRAEYESRIDVEITSAAPVDAAQQQALAAAIKQRLARDVQVEWKTDQSLIAGAVVRAGDLVVDGSFAGELERMRHALTA